MKLYLKSIVTFLLLSCLYIPVNAGMLSDTANIFFINRNGWLPAGARKIKDLKITDGGFKINCDYESIIEEAREKAIKAGGNIIVIKELKFPDMFSTCYRLFGEIYYYLDTVAMFAEKNKAHDSVMRTLLPDTAAYALLYVYRSRSSLGAAIPYNVMLDDSVICRIKRNSAHVIKVTKTGHVKISARTEALEEIFMKILPGKAYFLQCDIGMGVFIGRPLISLIDPYAGLQDFNKTKDKLKSETADPMY
ncbi:DUF2846 domain-containing protein [Chitinophaga nivalis]|uniref:DUF2846 domain-containing protein n=1 Tax=Chitinophaga nivalis TaxID=2991709 RepID=A0ABT3IK84_9BACT|nr:DUF2846 domain-containing protein [Chitinophaga nivalis]MCW3465955.1 DUF2846 domain-containing protein [Chitinophaga nivalis]MCW3484354.1 DUF2846 domain-containing protein [Chitinophaga nivalis]